jgi:hypothetical protein
MPNDELLAKLEAENARLIALLESNRIDWRLPSVDSAATIEASKLSTRDNNQAARSAPRALE